jgi:hypothetical protein
VVSAVGPLPKLNGGVKVFGVQVAENLFAMNVWPEV